MVNIADKQAQSQRHPRHQKSLVSHQERDNGDTDNDGTIRTRTNAIIAPSDLVKNMNITVSTNALANIAFRICHFWRIDLASCQFEKRSKDKRQKLQVHHKSRLGKLEENIQQVSRVNKLALWVQFLLIL